MLAFEAVFDKLLKGSELINGLIMGMVPGSGTGGGAAGAQK